MTYGLMLFANHESDLIGEAVSHWAELVRGDFPAGMKAPSSAPSCWKRVFDTTGHLLPKGRRVVAACAGNRVLDHGVCFNPRSKARWLFAYRQRP
jgi:hypothetical protein